MHCCVQIIVYRETKEECGLDVSDLDHVGTLIFEFVGEPQLLEVHVFRTEHYTGTVTESEGESPSISSDFRLSNFYSTFKKVKGQLLLLG